MRWLSERWTLFVVDKWAWILGISMLLTVGSVFAIKGLRLNTDLVSLLPDNFESVKSIRLAMDKFGGFGNFFLVVESADPERSKKFIDNVAGEIEKHPGVAYVDYKTEKGYFVKHKLLYVKKEDLQELRNRLKRKISFEKKYAIDWLMGREVKKYSMPLETRDLFEKYRGEERRIGSHEYFQTDDGKIFVLLIKPKATNTNIKQARVIRDELNQIVNLSIAKETPGSIKAGIAGTFVNRINEYEGLVNDIFSTALFSVLGVILILGIYFRQPLAIVFVSVPLFMGISWTFAITKFAIGELNLITGFLFAILFGLGIDFGIHMFSRYLEERTNGANVNVALVHILKQTGRPCFTSAITTSAAFYPLMIADFKGFSHFGFIAGTGVLLSLLAIYCVFPAMMIAGEKLKIIKIVYPLGHEYKKRKNRWFSPVVLVVGGIAIILGLASFSKVKFEYDFTQLRAKVKSTEELKDKYYKIFNESQTPAVVIASGKKELDLIGDKINGEKTKDLSPTVDNYRSIHSFIPDEQDVKMVTINEIQALLNNPILKLAGKSDHARIEDLRSILPDSKVTIDTLPETIKRQFRGRVNDGSEFGFIFPSVQLRDGKQAIEFAKDVRKIETDSGVYHPSSESIIFADMLEVMTKDGTIGLIVIFLIVFLLVWADFKHLGRTLIVLTPLVGGMIWMVGLMPLFGMKLNFFNMIILPVIIGIGIDNGIHIFHRYLELGPGSILTALRTSGGACMLTTATTMIGFSGCLFANHPGLQSLGMLALIGLTTTSIASFTIMPALVDMIEAVKIRLVERGKEQD